MVKSITCSACGFKETYPVPRYKLPSKCPNCKELDNGFNVHNLTPEYTPVVDLELQDDERLSVKVFGEETHAPTLGQTVNVIGNLHVLENDKVETVLFADSLEHENKQELTEDDIKEIQEWVQKQKEKIIDALVANFAPQLIDMDEAKKEL